ncbi:phenylalanine--tRNA ligase subunit beta [Prosthecochloris sp. HL-130-GSB]|jgi:phenylalanyl-tRNA synthetase beta chain|uniref:phenylalanine--tRNA ligase subunit beta n=1 Tax=Prosthecochloris sp. HL-130-GSB TaxID=1974213 RepID=UPI000A1C1327|nr:phenylalanine--tRNA ligase subunit beta [Prosthecochloris sp. HL-130-GSB]ARM31118.1 phenylalanine--tRNA ligase subunit beta [Prosthecochloris sp. HL-130-GSB]
MKISVNWLQDFIPSFSPDISKLVDQLTYAGLEVEDVISSQGPDEKVVVGMVEEVWQHPDADRLKVCRVHVGEEEPLQIVCGAPNVAAGQKVPVATVGALLPAPDGGSFVIKKSKLRGQRSSGMICAADELGLPGDHSGIMVLHDSCTVGTPVKEYLETDTVLDIAVTPNRPDVLSHLGVAREIAGLHGIRLPEAAEVSFSKAGKLARIDDPEACPYYTAVVIRNVTVGPSPGWLKERLEAIGLRPKNNIVDITNYILHALGQPLHAFDLARLDGQRVIVRSDIAAPVTALDMEEYVLEQGMLAICDESGPIAIGGVMGGYESAVSDQTTDILLEAAYFSPSSIRRTSKKLGLSTDSSYRFERGTDPGNVRFAACCAVKLILELAGGEVVSAEEVGAVPSLSAPVTLRPQRANALLGTTIAEEKMVSMLDRIGFSVNARHEDALEFDVPSFRVDVEQEIDLIEEIARLEGYNRIPASEKMVASYPQSRSFPEYFPDFLRSVMTGLGFSEVLTNPLMTGKEAGLFSSSTVAPLNPISEGLEVLRPSLVPAILKIIAHNINHGNRDLRFFEVAHVFSRLNRKPSGDDPLSSYEEKEFLVFAMTGARSPLNWSVKAGTVDMYDCRGAVEMLLRKLNLLDKSSLNIYNDTTLSIDLHVMDGGKSLTCHAGTTGAVAKSVLDAFDIDQPVYIAEIDAALLERYFSRDVIYTPPPRYPVVQRDLSFILPDGVTVQELVSCVRQSDRLITGVQVFDVFERRCADAKPETSIALSLQMVDSKGTLQEKTITRIIRKAVQRAESELGAVIRQV